MQGPCSSEECPLTAAPIHLTYLAVSGGHLGDLRARAAQLFHFIAAGISGVSGYGEQERNAAEPRPLNRRGFAAPVMLLRPMLV